MQKNELHIIYGKKPLEMIQILMDKIKLADQLDPNMHIALKPNLVVARPSKEGATTSPLIVEGLIRYLQDNGCRNISVIEGSWVGDSTARAFNACGYEEISRKYNIPLYDLKSDSYQTISCDNIGIKICERALNADYLINLPVLKAHCQTHFTCALKNLKGCIPDSEKRRFHSLGLHKPIAYLAKLLRPDLNIIDALNGDLTFEEGGNPVEMDRIIAGQDILLTDCYCASLIGYTIKDIGYLEIADKLGIGSSNYEEARIFEYGAENKSPGTFQVSPKAKKLMQYIDESESCSACTGSLIHALCRLEEEISLTKLSQKIKIGQGYKNKSISGSLGIGNCTSGCHRSLPGCPPKALDILHFLKDNIK